MTGKETLDYIKFLVSGLKGGGIAPDFSATDAEGKIFSLKEATAVKPVLLDFGCNS